MWSIWKYNWDSSRYSLEILFDFQLLMNRPQEEDKDLKNLLKFINDTELSL